MTDKEKVVDEIKDIIVQLSNIIDQLGVRNIAYYNSPEIASMLSGIGMEWGVGTNPDTGARQFTAYFRGEK